MTTLSRQQNPRYKESWPGGGTKRLIYKDGRFTVYLNQYRGDRDYSVAIYDKTPTVIGKEPPFHSGEKSYLGAVIENFDNVTPRSVPAETAQKLRSLGKDPRNYESWGKFTLPKHPFGPVLRRWRDAIRRLEYPRPMSVVIPGIPVKSEGDYIGDVYEPRLAPKTKPEIDMLERLILSQMAKEVSVWGGRDGKTKHRVVAVGKLSSTLGYAGGGVFTGYWEFPTGLGIKEGDSSDRLFRGPGKRFRLKYKAWVIRGDREMKIIWSIDATPLGFAQSNEAPYSPVLGHPKL